MTEEYYYRFEDRNTTAGPELYFYKYRVIKHTPCGVWIEYIFSKKFVLSDARKQFACPTIEEAKKSFRARKKRQLKILRSRVEQVERCLQQLEEWNDIQQDLAEGSLTDSKRLTLKSL